MFLPCSSQSLFFVGDTSISMAIPNKQKRNEEGRPFYKDFDFVEDENNGPPPEFDEKGRKIPRKIPRIV
jgi:hypothetical protein